MFTLTEHAQRAPAACAKANEKKNTSSQTTLVAAVMFGIDERNPEPSKAYTMYRENWRTGYFLLRHYRLHLQTFSLNLKHNTMQYVIQNAGKTSVKNQYVKFHYIATLCPIFTYVYCSLVSCLHR